MSTLEKIMVTSEHLQAETAMELPRRDMLLVTVVITNLLNNLSIDVDVNNNQIAVQVCAVVQALNSILLGGNRLTCTVQR